jgi:hypothetical protein
VRGTRRRRPWSAIATAIAAALVICCGAGLRNDEIECEEATAHLHDCCGGFDPSNFHCKYVEGCDSTTHPDLSIQTSVCIQDQSCDALKARGLCDAARTVPHGPMVCP